MKCMKCGAEMISASLCGGTTLSSVYLRNKKPGWLEEEKRSAVSCYVCPDCGYVELKADDPKGLVLKD